MKNLELISICAMLSLVAACGGGSGSVTSTTPPPGPSFFGTAATGMAISGASVNVKCVGGTGSAKTAVDGTFDVKLAAGALPCVLEVIDTVSNRKLHALSVAGGRINLTPLTEMLSTRLMRADMTMVFASPDATAISKAMTPENIGAAENEIAKALDGWVDTSRVSDFFGMQLKAATAANPSSGDAHDKVLDTLGAKLVPGLVTPLQLMLIKAKTINDILVLGQGGCLLTGNDGLPLSCGASVDWPTWATINITPASIMLSPGSKQNFTAEINYLSYVRYLVQPVTWSVVELDGGSISATGEYSAPAKPGVYHVQAVRQDAQGVSSTSTVVVSDAAANFVPTLSLQSRSVTMRPGASAAFDAEINYRRGVFYIRAPISWSVVEADGGVVNTVGAYTAPQKVGVYHLKVQRDDYSEINAMVEVKVTLAPK